MLMREILVSPRGQGGEAIGGGASSRRGRVIAITGGKGGIGKTTFAINIAIAVAQETKEPVAILDLFIGDTLALVNAEAPLTLSEIPEAVQDLDLKLLRSYAVRHESGVDFYTWFFAPERNLPEYIDLNRLEMVLRWLRDGYTYTFMDTPVTLYAPDLELLTLTDEVFVVAVPWDLLALRATKALVLALQTHWHITPNLIFNRVQPDSALTPEFVAEQLGLPIWGIVPNETQTVVRSVNAGIPAILQSPHSPYSDAIRNLARKLVGLPAQERRRLFPFF